MLLLGTYSRAARLLFICDPASSRNRDFRLKRMKKMGLSRRDLAADTTTCFGKRKSPSSPSPKLKRELHVGLMQTSAKPAATRQS
jgi:hypothetical protein